MKIKDLKIFNKINKDEKYNIKKDIKLKIAAIILGGVMFLPTVPGCSKNKTEENVSDSIQVEEELDTKVFQPGEHIILVCNEIYSQENQVDYHEGYEIIDTSSFSIGRKKYSSVYYSNTVPVECKGNIYSGTDKILYEDFGIPIENNKVYTIK